MSGSLATLRNAQPPPGWLARELPRPLAEDEFTLRFLRIFEEVAGDIRVRIAEFTDDLDPGLAPPEFVRWMAGWLGLALDPSLPEEQQRSLVRAAGPLFPLRGTKTGLQRLLEAFTRSDVEVGDGGGVYAAGGAPPASNQVTIRVSSAGGLSEQQLLELVRLEIPATAVVDLRVGRRRVKEEDAAEGAEEMPYVVEGQPAPEAEGEGPDAPPSEPSGEPPAGPPDAGPPDGGFTE
jgi:phage tail-like protein